jgi:hypothetical protein
MKRLTLVVVFLFSTAPAFAMPQFLQMFRMDPFRNPAFDGCNTCHMSPEGGDARNAFGQAFESGGERITPILRAQFPDRFIYPISRVSDALTIHFSDPNNKQVVVEAGGMKNVVDVEQKTVNGQAATLPNAPAAPAAAAPASGGAAQEASRLPVDPYAHEGAFFGSNVVNLPDGKPMKGGSFEFFVGHRFVQDIKAASISGLFGFDSSAYVAYGVRYAVTDRFNFGVLRTNNFRTISLNTAFQITRQSAEMPLTLQLRGGVDGKNNFGWYSKEDNPLPRQYSPFIQIVATRSFKDRVSFTAIPIFAFNTRDETQAFLRTFGAEHNHTVSLGVGTAVRFLPTVSLVGEYIPQLWGYRGEGEDHPGVSFGLQKSTFRHTFTLVFARQLLLTPAQVAYQGHDKFHIGFNIYRKLR